MLLNGLYRIKEKKVWVIYKSYKKWIHQATNFKIKAWVTIRRKDYKTGGGLKFKVRAVAATNQMSLEYVSGHGFSYMYREELLPPTGRRTLWLPWCCACSCRRCVLGRSSSAWWRWPRAGRGRHCEHLLLSSSECLRTTAVRPAAPAPHAQPRGSGTPQTHTHRHIMYYYDCFQPLGIYFVWDWKDFLAKKLLFHNKLHNQHH